MITNSAVIGSTMAVDHMMTAIIISSVVFFLPFTVVSFQKMVRSVVGGGCSVAGGLVFGLVDGVFALALAAGIVLRV